MSKNPYILLFFIMTIVTTQMVAQDIHFSQFYASPLTLNPAETGMYKGDMRICSNYRTQWKSIDNKPFATIGLGIEKQYHHFSDTYSFGIQFITDESGYVGLISNKLFISGAFSKKINGHKISGGIQLGGVSRTTNTIRYTYDDQFDLGGDHVFNPKLPTSEVPGDPILYGVVNVGLLWSKQISKRINPKVGISFFNLNTPKESFYNLDLESTVLPIRSAISLGGTYSLNSKLSLCPNIIYMTQKKATEFLLGGNVEYKLSKETIPFIGTTMRYGMQNNFDASSWIAGMQYKNVRVGISYDINISKLQEATNNKGAFEISLIYITPSIQSTYIKIPCDRI